MKKIHFRLQVITALIVFNWSSDSLLGYSDFSYTNSNFSVNWMRKFNDDFDGSLTAYG